MGKQDNMEEEMTVELTLDDGTNVTCAIITILEVEGKDYIVLLPLDENGNNDDGEVWFYGYSENPDDPNEEPELGFIDAFSETDATVGLPLGGIVALVIVMAYLIIRKTIVC